MHRAADRRGGAPLFWWYARRSMTTKEPKVSLAGEPLDPLPDTAIEITMPAIEIELLAGSSTRSIQFMDGSEVFFAEPVWVGGALRVHYSMEKANRQTIAQQWALYDSALWSAAWLEVTTEDGGSLSMANDVTMGRVKAKYRSIQERWFERGRIG